MSLDGAPKLILVLGAGQYYVRVIERLQDSGFRTLVVDRDRDAPGLRVGDLSYPIDIADRTAVLALARELEIDGVLPLNDFGVRTAAHISHEMGLPGLSPTTAELANDKGLMRQRWERDQLPIPDFRVVGSAADARAAYRELGPPLVVKPTDAGGGGRGVSIVRSEQDLAWSYDFASPFASNGRIIVERFVEGLEVTVETISQRGRVHVLTMSDKVKPEQRTPVATSLNYPAALPEAVSAEVAAVAARAVSSVGVADGPAHVEVIVSEGRAVLVEMGARGGGGHIFSTIVEAVTGIDMVVQSARVLVGETADLRSTRIQGCVYRLLSPERGVIRSIEGVAEASLMPGVIDLGITRAPGDVLGDMVNSLQRSGFAVVVGPTREDAIKRADAVCQAISFRLDPLPEAG